MPAGKYCEGHRADCLYHARTSWRLFSGCCCCCTGTPVVEIGYTHPRPMPYPSYYHTMARRLGHPFWTVLGRGGYDSPIVAPVAEVVASVSAALGSFYHAP